jgi:arsenical pump membrane protein
VLAHERLSGAEFARRMLLPWLVVVAITIAFVAAVFRLRDGDGTPEPLPPLRLGVGATATAIATALILGLHNPALPVLVVGLTAIALERIRPHIGVPVLTGLFAFAVVLGTLARRWYGPADLLGHLGAPGAAIVGAIASVLVNNLPAATLLSAQPPEHPLALLIGLNLGPNLLFTGSLSTYLWYQTAQRADAHPSLRLAALLGLGLVPLTISAALIALMPIS